MSLARGNICEACRAARTEEQLAALVRDPHVDLQPTLGGELAQAVRARVVVKLVNPRAGSLSGRTVLTSHGHQLNLWGQNVEQRIVLWLNLLVAASTLLKHCWSSTAKWAKMVLKKDILHFGDFCLQVFACGSSP